MLDKQNPRLVATKAVLETLRGRSLDRALRHARGHPARALIFKLAYGAVRQYFTLNAVLDVIVRGKLEDQEVRACLLVGAYQLLYTEQRRHAVVNDAVAIARKLGVSSAAGLVNAVLRRLGDAPPEAPARLNFPSWLVKRIEAQYGHETETILSRSDTQAPMAIRVNKTRCNSSTYKHLLDQAGIAHQSGLLSETFVLNEPRPQASLPGYEEGLFAVQDSSAQLAAFLIGAGANDRVLDACAAPGGKAFHIMERGAKRVTALDISANQIEFAGKEAERLGHDLDFIKGDARSLSWWDGKPFDRVLLDAPCSGTGSLRRHPDIKLLRRDSDIPRYQETQLELLNSVWRTLRRGGRLIYATCSILAEENDAVISKFLATAKSAKLEDISVYWGRVTRRGRLILPGTEGGDGFYYARLGKR